jgi:RNA polymerase sigma-70 factor, ECF subfamily
MLTGRVLVRSFGVVEDVKTPVTLLLRAWKQGDRTALDQLVPLIHEDLRRLARQRMSGIAPGASLQATALVNEAYLRLAKGNPADFQDRAHFFAISATVMRQIIVDEVRSKGRDKRGGDWTRVALEDADVDAGGDGERLLGIDRALRQLATVDGRKAQVVEMRFFAGMTNGEIAEVLGVSADTVKRDWSFAKLWLARELGGGAA